MAISVCGALWATDFLGADSLGWTVPTLATIEIGVFVPLYMQRSKVMQGPARPPVEADQAKPKAAADNILTPQAAPISVEVAKVNGDMNDLTLSSLTEVIGIVAERLGSLSQVESAVTFLGLNARLPSGLADARQQWQAVFAAAIEDEKLASLISYVRDHLGLRPQRQLESALRDIGFTL